MNNRCTGLCVCVLWVAVVSSAALAQSSVGTGPPSPTATPPASCFPSDIDACCWATYTAAAVTGTGPAYIVDPGTTSIWSTPWVVCDNCRQPNCSQCDAGFPIRVCNAGVGLTVSSSATATLNAGLSVGITPQVKLSLGGALGISIGASVTLSADCPIPTTPCEILKSRVKITTVAGRKAAVDHNWHINGIWVTSYSCGPGGCPIQGNPWQADCPTTSSIGTA